MASAQLEQAEVAGYEVFLAAGVQAAAPADSKLLLSAAHGGLKKGIDIDLGQLAVEVRKLLEDLVDSWHGTSQDLGKVTRDIVNHFLYAFPRYNVMVVHPAHLASFEDYVKDGVDVPYAYFLKRHFDVYVLKRGSFTLLADGGYQNWAFGGNWVRNDKHVVFSDR